MTTYIIKITEIINGRELIHTYSFNNFDEVYQLFKQESYNVQKRLCEMERHDTLYAAFVELEKWRNGEYIEALATYLAR